jgi:DNA-binding MarR family transcriptional regulator
MTTETHLKILKYMDSNPHVSQRELAEELGVSVGKVNYCVKALIDKGQVKAGNFKRSSDKKAYLYLLTPAGKINYLYLLTPQGIEEKARLTARFLKRKIAEHEQICKEIEQLKRDSR